MHKKIAVGVVGLGYWGPILLRNFHNHPNFKIKWGCDLASLKIKKCKKTFPFLNYSNKIDELLNDDELEFIAIATPPHTHFGLAKKVLSSGKHLWIEKPFTTKNNDAEEIFKIAKNKKLYLHVDFPYIFHDPVLKIKKIIDKEQIGKLYYYSSIRENLGLVQEKVNVIWDLAPHDLSILFYLFPKFKVKRIESSGSNHLKNHSEFEIANIVIKFDNGFTAYIHLSWLSPTKTRLIKIGGSKKMIEFDDIKNVNKIKLFDKSISINKNTSSLFNPFYKNGSISKPTIIQKEALFNELEFVYKQLTQKDFNYETVQIALKIHQVLKQI